MLQTYILSADIDAIFQAGFNDRRFEVSSKNFICHRRLSTQRTSKTSDILNSVSAEICILLLKTSRLWNCIMDQYGVNAH
jgi:hypothetical protein